METKTKIVVGAGLTVFAAAVIAAQAAQVSEYTPEKPTDELQDGFKPEVNLTNNEPEGPLFI